MTNVVSISTSRGPATLKGFSGLTYEAREHPLDAPPDGAGIYVFAGPRSIPTGREAFYIGAADDLPARVSPSHRALARARALGATHLLIVRCPDEKQRQAITRDLVEFYRPSLNRPAAPRLGKALLSRRLMRR